MIQNNNNVRGGIGFTGLLTIVFIVLKLTNVINWSWLWVLSPLWVSLVLILLVIVIVLIVCLHGRHERTNIKKNKRIGE